MLNREARRWWFNSILPASGNFLGAFSGNFSVHYFKVINEIPPRKQCWNEYCFCRIIWQDILQNIVQDIILLHLSVFRNSRIFGWMQNILYFPEYSSKYVNILQNICWYYTNLYYYKWQMLLLLPTQNISPALENRGFSMKRTWIWGKGSTLLAMTGKRRMFWTRGAQCLYMSG